MNCASVAYDALSQTAVCSVRPSNASQSQMAGAAALPTRPLVSAHSPMLTVFKVTPDGNTSVSSRPTSLVGSSKPPRWKVVLQSQQRVQFEQSTQLHPTSSNVNYACIAQLVGHRQSSTMGRAAIFSHGVKCTTAGSGPITPNLLVACGDDESDQCVVWDVAGENVLSRLNGQNAPITHVHHSDKLNLLATVSTNTCCLYSTASPI
jgi:hypothetical protein